MVQNRAVTLRLYPPYSLIVGKSELAVELSGPIPAEEFFARLCREYPKLGEMLFPSGSRCSFPGTTAVLRGGLSLKVGDLVCPGDVLEVLIALSGG